MLTQYQPFDAWERLFDFMLDTLESHRDRQEPFQRPGAINLELLGFCDPICMFQTGSGKTASVRGSWGYHDPYFSHSASWSFLMRRLSGNPFKARPRYCKK